MVDTRDSKSRDSNIMRVQVSPAALLMHIVTLTKINIVLLYETYGKNYCHICVYLLVPRAERYVGA